MAGMRRALVLTASDGAAAGVRDDTSGGGVGERLEALGFSVDRVVVSDERSAIEPILDHALETLAGPFEHEGDAEGGTSTQ